MKRFMTLKNTPLILSLATLVAGSGCSLKENQGEDQVLRISLPTQSELASSIQPYDKNSKYGLANSSLKSSYFPRPQSVADFQCFAINVTGAGIPSDDRMTCRSPEESMGKFVGFMPPGSEVEVLVPAGANRRIQLIGIQSKGGCPAWDSLFKNGEPDETVFKDLDRPVELASTQADVFGDITVQLKINFNPSQPKWVFSSCKSDSKDGEELMPAFVLNKPAPGTSGLPSLPLSIVPSTNETFSTQYPRSLFESEFGKYYEHNDATSMHFGLKVEAAANNSPNAEIWYDVSQYSVSDFAHAGFETQFNHALNGTACPALNSNHLENAGVVASLYNAKLATWQHIGRSAPSTHSGNYWGFLPHYYKQVSYEDLIFTHSNGKKYIILNFKSEYVSQANCTASIRLTNFGLRLLPKDYTSSYSSGGHIMASLPASTNVVFKDQMGTGTDYFVKFGTSNIKPIIQTGIYPVSFSSSGCASLVHPTTGEVNLSGCAAGNTAELIVSNGASSTTLKFHIKGANDAFKLKLNVTSSDGSPLPSFPVTAGTCLKASVSAVGFPGVTPSWNPSGGLSAASESFSKNSSPVNSLYSTEPNCTGDTNDTSGSLNATTATFYFKPKKVGYAPTPGMPTNSISVSGSGLSSSQVMFSLTAKNSTPYQFKVQAPPYVHINTCHPVVFKIADQYGNDLNSLAGGVNTGINTTGSAAVFSSSICSGSSSTEVSFGTTPQAQYYFNGPTVSTTTAASIGLNPISSDYLAGSTPVTFVDTNHPTFVEIEPVNDELPRNTSEFWPDFFTVPDNSTGYVAMVIKLMRYTSTGSSALATGAEAGSIKLYYYDNSNNTNPSINFISGYFPKRVAAGESCTSAELSSITGSSGEYIFASTGSSVSAGDSYINSKLCIPFLYASPGSPLSRRIEVKLFNSSSLEIASPDDYRFTVQNGTNN